MEIEGSEIVILASALKRRYTQDDILHAINFYLDAFPADGYTMIIGPALNGEIIEVAISSDNQVFHAMKARSKFTRRK